MTNINDCFNKGLLTRGNKDMGIAKKSIKQAEFFIEEADDMLESNKKHLAAILLYNAFFHASRALLFKDGIKERSHYCIARYVEHYYVNPKKIDIKFLNAFETVMSIRHNVQYSTDKIEIEEDLNELVNLCQDYIEVVEKIINPNDKPEVKFSE